MARFSTLVLTVILSCYSVILVGQSITVDTNYNAQQLAEDILVNNPCLVISNASITSSNVDAFQTTGYFTANTANFPFAQGIILSTGNATSAIGPNTSLLSEGSAAWPGDNDLEAALNVSNTINATVLEFDFVSLSAAISFRYLLASEQYLTNPSPNQCNFTDGFAFLLKRNNSNDPYQNLAVVPGTDIPVRINTVRGSGTVCPPANEQYFQGYNGGDSATNFNGQTVPLTAEANVIPGESYHIKLVVADQGNNLFDSAIFLEAGSFEAVTDLGDDRTLANGNPLCVGETLTVDATQIGSNVSYSWFRNGVLLANASPVFTIDTAGLYEVEANVNNNSCLITGRIEVDFSSIAAIPPVTLRQCDPDGDGITTFNLNKLNEVITNGNAQLLSPTYFENATDTNPISNPTQFTANFPKTIFAKVQNSFGCETTTTVNLVGATSQNAVPLTYILCDTDNVKDGKTVFNLNSLATADILLNVPSNTAAKYFPTENDALWETQEITADITNDTANSQTYYARLYNGIDCFDIIPISISIDYIQEDFSQTETIYFCSGTLATLTAPAGYNNYRWSHDSTLTNREIRLNTPQTYTVTFSNQNGCEASKTFEVIESNQAVIVNIAVTSFAGDLNSANIEVSGLGDYQYSIDGSNFQDSPLFTNINPGVYTVTVVDAFGCEPTSAEFIVLDYPRFFTPNGDGFNDIWTIKNSFLTKQIERVVIFDRFGNIIYGFTPNQTGWDGQYLGRPLPADDYWFNILLQTGAQIKGHFTLKR